MKEQVISIENINEIHTYNTKEKIYTEIFTTYVNTFKNKVIEIAWPPAAEKPVTGRSGTIPALRPADRLCAPGGGRR